MTVMASPFKSKLRLDLPGGPGPDSHRSGPAADAAFVDAGAFATDIGRRELQLTGLIQIHRRDAPVGPPRRHLFLDELDRRLGLEAIDDPRDPADHGVWRGRDGAPAGDEDEQDEHRS